MKIIFMGTPQLVCPILETLHQQHEILFVVTQPDKPQGRNRKLLPPSIKTKALELGLTVSQPTNLKDPEWIQSLKECNADLFVVVAFSILPPQVFKLPKYGSINIHFSLLPKYRGAAPVQWAILKGEQETGISIFTLNTKMDDGDILAQKSLKITSKDTTLTVANRLVKLSQPLLLQTLTDLENGNISPIKQNLNQVSLAPKLYKENGYIRWNQSSQTIDYMIRALNPYPIAYGILNTQKKLRIHQATPTNTKKSSLSLGSIFINENQYPEVVCQTGTLILKEIQLEGKAKILGNEFVNGLQNKQDLQFIETIKN